MKDDSARPWRELNEHVHPLLPDPERYELIHASFDIDPDMQTVTAVRLTLRSKDKQTIRTFEFSGFSSPDHGPLQLPVPYGRGIKLIDITYRQWSNLKVEVLHNYEEAPAMFWASSVREITQQ